MNPIEVISYDRHQSFLRVILIISLILLGIAIWQALDHSITPTNTAAKPDISTASAPKSGLTLDQENERIKQDLAESRESIQSLKATNQESKRRVSATVWWVGAVGLTFHIANIVHLMRKLAKDYTKDWHNHTKLDLHKR